MDFKIREVTKGRLITEEAFKLILSKMPDGFEKLSAAAIFVKAMEAMVGVHEDGGNNSGKEVEAIQDTVGRPEKEAWCMATIQTAIAFVEVVSGVSSRFPVTEHCLTAYYDSLVKYMSPKIGYVCIWQHGQSQNGHTGAVVGVDHYEKNKFITVEGNTSSGSGINRDGDGVYLRQRSMFGAGDMHVKGFLEPFPV